MASKEEVIGVLAKVYCFQCGWKNPKSNPCDKRCEQVTNATENYYRALTANNMLRQELPEVK
jgi:hypothetical protein